MSSALGVLLLKLTIWCSLPFALQPVLRRLSSATRHLVLTLALVGALLLPLSGLWAPHWARLPVLPAPPSVISTHPVPAGSPTVDAPRSLSAPLRALSSGARGENGTPMGSATRVRPRPQPVGTHRHGSPSARSSAFPTSPTAGRESASLASDPASNPLGSVRLSRRAGLPAVWLIGLFLLLVRFLRAVRATARLVEASTPLTDARLEQAARRVRDRLGIDRLPKIRECARVRAPFAWGLRRPTIVLPPAWRDWSENRLTAVLLHELAHLARRDGLALWAGRLATAVWWFHPLVWRLDRWTRAECEHATDDAVLGAGERASHYADHLLAIHHTLKRPLPAGGTLMMSNHNDLERRLMSILRDDLKRRGLDRRLITRAGAVVLTLFVALAGLQLTVQAQADAFDDTSPALDGIASLSARPETQEPRQERRVERKRERERVREQVRERKSVHHGCEGCEAEPASEGEAAWERAYELHRAGDYAGAITAFEASAEAGYRPATAIYNAACGYSLSGDSRSALAALDRARELGFDSLDLLTGDTDLDPLRSDPAFQDLVDRAFREQGLDREAIGDHRYRDTQERLAYLRETSSKNAEAWHEVGTALLTLRELRSAAEALERAASLERERPSTSLYNRACALALDGQEREALAALETAIHQGFTNPEHLRADPDLRSLRGTPAFEALVQLADDLDLDRFRRPLWEEHRKGMGHHWGQHSEYSVEAWAPAIDFYRSFTAEHTDLGIGWYNLGWALHHSRRFDEAIEAFGQARTLGYRPAGSTYNIACGYAMMEQTDQALEWLEAAVAEGWEGRGLEHDDDLDSLRDDPRFRRLRLRLRMG